MQRDPARADLTLSGANGTVARYPGSLNADDHKDQTGTLLGFASN